MKENGNIRVYLSKSDRLSKSYMYWSRYLRVNPYSGTNTVNKAHIHN